MELRRATGEALTWIFGVLGTNVIVARIQDVLVHKRRSGSDLPEEADFHRFTDFDALAALHEDLPCVLAAIAAVERRHAVLLRVMAFFEWL